MSSNEANSSTAARLYRLMLRTYPQEFRREYGYQMSQVFRDCERATVRNGRSIPALWLRVVGDLVITATRERIESFREEKLFMKSRDIVALLGCIAIIAIAFMLLSYGRSHEVSSILLFGHALDAFVVTGVVGNLIVFLLAKTTRFNPFRIALWTFLIVNGVPAVLLAIVGGRIDPQFKIGATVVGYLVSFLFWVSLHWAWGRSRTQTVN